MNNSENNLIPRYSRILKISNDRIIFSIYTEGRNAVIEKNQMRYPLLPCKKINGEWKALSNNAFCFDETGVFELRIGQQILQFDPLSLAWRDAIFAMTMKEKLMILVKHYLLVPKKANPLTALLQTPNPVKGHAEKIVELLEGAIGEKPL